VNLYLHRT